MPKVLNVAIIDDIVGVDDVDAFKTARRLAAEEGILAGISAGAAAWAALQVAEKLGLGAAGAGGAARYGGAVLEHGAVLPRRYGRGD